MELGSHGSGGLLANRSLGTIFPGGVDGFVKFVEDGLFAFHIFGEFEQFDL